LFYRNLSALSDEDHDISSDDDIEDQNVQSGFAEGSAAVSGLPHIPVNQISYMTFFHHISADLIVNQISNTISF